MSFDSTLPSMLGRLWWWVWFPRRINRHWGGIISHWNHSLHPMHFLKDDGIITPAPPPRSAVYWTSIISRYQSNTTSPKTLQAYCNGFRLLTRPLGIRQVTDFPVIIQLAGGRNKFLVFFARETSAFFTVSSGVDISPSDHYGVRSIQYWTWSHLADRLRPRH